MVAGNHLYMGIHEAEAQDRANEHRTGVPPLGAMRLLLHAPIPYTTGVKAANVGPHPCELRLKSQGQTKAIATRNINALRVGVTEQFLGRMHLGSITPGSVLINEAGALADIVDDGNGVLHDVGIPANTRGTINYETGDIDFTWGAASTNPVVISFTHTDYTDFASPLQSTTHTFPGGTGDTPATAEVVQLGFGRVVNGSVGPIVNGGQTFIDDAKGHLIQSVGGTWQVAGRIDYGTGILTFDAAAAALGALAVAIPFAFNPFAALVAAGAACKLLDIHGSAIPELTQQSWAAGIRGEDRVGLAGVATEAGSNGTHLVTQWMHFGEEPYRVEETYSGFPPGGAAALGQRNA